MRGIHFYETVKLPRLETSALKVFSLLILLTCMHSLVYGQQKLTIVNEYNIPAFTIAEHTKVKVKYKRDGKLEKVTGNFSIENSKTIWVGIWRVHIDSIYKIGNYSNGNQLGGHIVAGLGAGLFAGGAHTLWVSEQSSGLGELVNGIIGSGLVFIGGIQVLVGEYIASGNMHSTRRYKRKVVLE